MHITKNSGTLLLVLLVMAGTAKGGLLTSDTAAFETGSQIFTKFGFLNAEVDYAVYKPGQFQQSSALGDPTDPSGGKQYVYAYQILNNTGGSESVSDLSVGLSDIGGPTQGQNKQVTIINWITLGNGETPPSDGTANGGPPAQNVIWDFPGGTELPVGDVSSILYFTSPFPPEMDNATVLGGLSATGFLPSPVPEPSSALLLFSAGVVLLSIRMHYLRGMRTSGV